MRKKFKYLAISLSLLTTCLASATATYLITPHFFPSYQFSEPNVELVKETASAEEQIAIDTKPAQVSTEAASISADKVVDQSPSPRPSSSPSPITDPLLLELMDYFNLNSADSLTVKYQTDKHAQGQIGQKWWLAIYNNSSQDWRIVASGGSYINCADIVGYNFPSNMAPACWDYGSNQLIER